MVLLCKHRALYVKACIIANGVTDSQGDTLQTEDIKKIFTSFNNSDNFEIYHNEIPIENVSLLENYIATADETIGTNIVPSGSWLAVIRVDNPDIQERLLKGEFKGVSLNNKIATECKGSLTGAVRYQDVADAECVIPVYISFVEAGANGYGLHVMDYDAYIQKSKDVKITNNNNIGDTIMDLKEFLEGLKSLIQKAEETPDDSAKDEDPKEPKEEEAVEVKKEEPQSKEEEEDEEPVVKKAEDEPVKEAEPTTEPSTKEEDKADEITQLEERISKLEKIIEELTKEEEDDTKEDEKPTKEETDTPKITKSKNVILENQNNTVNTNYYEMTGRDPVTGLKIRNTSKIL